MIRLLSFLFLLSYLPINAQQKNPKLIVGIVIDQMRDEYIDRFYEDFGNDGFKRLLNNGYRMKNMHYNYMPTYTGPGHASIYTGTTPAYHGIVGNYWYQREAHKGVYCTSDENYSTLGEPEKPEEGQMAPTRMLSTTVTDELKLSSNFRSKVIGISLKDRGAILPAGHFADAAYWMAGNGHFISSTYYNETLPKWVSEFNSKKLYAQYLSQPWNLLKPESTYDESSADNSLFEGKLADILDAKFPYDLPKAYKESGADIIKTTPFGNSILEDFAEAAILNEKMGQSEFTDFLALSFSSTDYIGHLLGPRSRELQDTYLRLDETLAKFLKFLDSKVGKGNYMIFLTADHACAENPNFMNEHMYKITNLNSKTVKSDIEEFSTKTFGVNLVENYSNQNLFIDIEKLMKKNLNLNEVLNSLQDYIQTLPYVKRALIQNELLSANNNFLIEMISNGYDPKQNGQIVILYQPGYYEYPDFGTTHGTPYSYDTHVPMLWYGYGIKKGISYDKHMITEVAPTISQMLHITLPNASKNEVIESLLN